MLTGGDKFLSTRTQSGGVLEMRVMNIRLHELAAELGLPSRRVLELLRKMDVPVKGPSSALLDADADALRQALRTDPSLRVDGPVSRGPAGRRINEWRMFENSGFATFAEWTLARAALAVNIESRRAAAAQSQAIWEAKQRERRREGDPAARPSRRAEPRFTFVQGGAPGLGKRR